jgi:hypothetical protein
MAVGAGAHAAELPARAHFEWVIRKVGTGAIDPAEFARHATPADLVAAHRPEGVDWHAFIAGNLAVSRGEVDGDGVIDRWRVDRQGMIVVTYTGADGKEHDLSAGVDAATGRLVAPAVAPSTGDVDVVFESVVELSSADLDALGDVVRACYDRIDEAWLERRLTAMSDVAIAWLEDEALGFAGSGVFSADVPGLPACRMTVGGVWIRPEARGLRLARAIQARHMASNLMGPFDFTLLSFASPITFQMQFPGPFVWPGTTLDVALRSLDTASAEVRSLTAEVALAAGSLDFDERRWIAHGLEHGTANVTPQGIDAAVDALFGRVDQASGDTLTFPASMGSPPAFLRR